MEKCVKPSEDSQNPGKSVQIVASKGGGGRFVREAPARATQMEAIWRRTGSFAWKYV